MLIENILPLDYYSIMAGVLIDQKVFFEIFKEKFPKIHKHLKILGFDCQLVVF